MLYILFSCIYIYCYSSGQKDCPGDPVKYSYGGKVCDLVSNTFGKRYPKKFFYQEMHMPIDELENKKPVKVSAIIWFLLLNICSLIIYFVDCLVWS